MQQAQMSTWWPVMLEEKVFFSVFASTQVLSTLW
jgi:hypothetical protein